MVKGYNSNVPNNINENERKLIERLHEEFVGIFNRSILPEKEKPRIDRHEIDEKVGCLILHLAMIIYGQPLSV